MTETDRRIITPEDEEFPLTSYSGIDIGAIVDDPIVRKSLENAATDLRPWIKTGEDIVLYPTKELYKPFTHFLDILPILVEVGSELEYTYHRINGLIKNEPRLDRFRKMGSFDYTVYRSLIETNHELMGILEQVSISGAPIVGPITHEASLDVVISAAERAINHINDVLHDNTVELLLTDPTVLLYLAEVYRFVETIRALFVSLKTASLKHI